MKYHGENLMNDVFVGGEQKEEQYKSLSSAI